jgi:hypothetical protein
MVGDQVGMLAQAIAGAFDLDDDSMVKEPVEQRGGDDRITEDLAPLGKAAIGGQDHHSLFIAGINQLEGSINPLVLSPAL